MLVDVQDECYDPLSRCLQVLTSASVKVMVIILKMNNHFHDFLYGAFAVFSAGTSSNLLRKFAPNFTKYEKNVNSAKECTIPLAIFFDIRYNNNRIFVLKKICFDFL